MVFITIVFLLVASLSVYYLTRTIKVVKESTLEDLAGEQWNYARGLSEELNKMYIRKY